jgi:hypothetical protein
MKAHAAAAAVLSLAFCAGCAGAKRPGAGDEAAVYEALLSQPMTADSALMPEVSVRMPLSYVIGPTGKSVDEMYIEQVAEALDELSRYQEVLLSESVLVSEKQRRLPARHARALFDSIRLHRIERVPNGASIVQISRVGFSRDGSVAVVYRNAVCGENCGRGEVRAVRRHPLGWLPAEVLAEWVY